MKTRIIKKELINSILMFVYLTISLLSKIFQSFLGINRSVLYILFFILLILGIFYNLKKNLNDIFLFYLFVAPIFIIGILKNNKFIPLIDMASMLINVLPAYFIFRIKLEEKLFYKIYVYAVIINLLGYIPLSILTKNYMDYSYHVALNGALALCIYLYKKNISMLIFFLIAVLCVLGYGARGAILCLSVFFIYIFYRNIYKKNVLIKILLIVFVIILAFNYKYFLLFLYKVYPNSRILTTIIQGKFIQSEGRIGLYIYCKKLLVANKWGYGPLSTRELISWQPYPHSLLLELLIDYGIIIGGGLFLGIIYVGKRLICNYYNNIIAGIGICYWIMGFTMLSISGSIYYNSYLFIALAILVRSIKISREKDERKNNRNY